MPSKEKQMPALRDKTVLVIGRGSGIARAIALAVSADEAGIRRRASPGRPGRRGSRHGYRQ